MSLVLELVMTGDSRTTVKSYCSRTPITESHKSDHLYKASLLASETASSFNFEGCEGREKEHTLNNGDG